MGSDNLDWDEISPTPPQKVEFIKIREILNTVPLHAPISTNYFDSSLAHLAYYDLEDLKFEFYQRVAALSVINFDEPNMLIYTIRYEELLNQEIEWLTAKRLRSPLYDFYVRVKLTWCFSPPSFFEGIWKSVETHILRAREVYNIPPEAIWKIYPDGRPGPIYETALRPFNFFYGIYIPSAVSIVSVFLWSLVMFAVVWCYSKLTGEI
ncbi:MAG: hypothetical protein WDW21_04745 [Neisseriaceae bacterium]